MTRREIPRTDASSVQNQEAITTGLPSDLLKWVGGVADTVVSDDLAKLVVQTEVDNRTHKLKTILTTWESQQNEERELRTRFAKWVLGALMVQMALVGRTTISGEKV